MFHRQALYSFGLTAVEDLAAAERHLAGHGIDVVLLDLELPDAPGVEAVRRIHKALPRVAMVLLCDPGSEPTAVEAMQAGAQDYLIKDEMEARELMRALRNAVERRTLEDALFREKERAEVTLESIGDAVICTDELGNISFLNPVAEAMTGWGLKEAAGQPMMDVFRIQDAATGLAAENPMESAMGENLRALLPANCVLQRRDGSKIFIEDSVAPIHDREGQAAGSVLVFRDVTAARSMAAQIAHSAEHDALTGLPNRLLLNDRLGQALARAHRDAGLVAVLFLDLDGFKYINDSLGHAVGDQLLQSVAKRLESCIRAPDTISRLGGDEFIVLLHGVQNPQDAAIAAGRLLSAVAKGHFIGLRDLHITASIGISIYPDDGLDAETLIQNADTAMYQAKESGRRNCRFFTPEMNARAVERQSIEEDLRHALERNEFTLHYQPKIHLSSGAISGAEALLRWTHPTRGSVPPKQFIPVAEATGLILAIGAWVLREACRQTKVWADRSLPIPSMAVNVSAVEFRSRDFLSGLLATLGESGLDPKSLELEVTESVLMERPEVTAPLLESLRKRGIRVTIDDFGTGYSSLNYLQKLPLDALKIDQSFARPTASNPGDTAILGAIISMGRSLSLRVIVEGIETAGVIDFLKAQGCDEGQGFFLGRPVPPEQFVSLLEAQVV
jgi:diguanylate cyclase (GGDEF)-like protein/PAS domain S-box-containing protein